MERIITVTGTGKASARPDLVVIPITLTARDTDYEATLSAAADQLEALRVSLSASGFAKEDIKTSDFSVDTQYESVHDENGNYKRVFSGYCCLQRLSIEFDRNAELLSGVISALSECEAKPEFQISFSVKNKDAVLAAILENAAANAREKARILCRAAGVKLGKLQSISCSRIDIEFRSPTAFAMCDGINEIVTMKRSIDIEPEDIEAEDSVTFIWSIE